MPNAAPVLTSRSRVLRLIALLLASLTVATAVPTAASAQSIMQDPQTKQEAQQAQAAAEKAASTGSSSGSSDRSITIGLLILGAGLLGGAAWWIVRDSGDSVREDARRAAPGRPLNSDAVGRGAPRTMFAGEGEPGGKTGKRRKREQGKRQRQARKANRPR